MMMLHRRNRQRQYSGDGCGNMDQCTGLVVVGIEGICILFRVFYHSMSSACRFWQGVSFFLLVQSQLSSEKKLVVACVSMALVGQPGSL